jgi:HK97 gp10 family phage protein
MPFSITGLNETINALEAWKTEIIEKVIPEELKNAGNLLVQKAQGKARVDTGYMRDNIKITETTPTSVTVVSEADYSIYNEEGTSRMSAQPFMFNSALEVEQEFIGELGTRVKTVTSMHFKTK